MTDRPFDPALLRQIEDAGLNASAVPQQRWIDGWIVRTSPGKAKRARCIQAVAPGHGDLSTRLARCEAWFAECGLPPVFRLTPYSQPAGLDDWLEDRGWKRFDDTRVMVLEHLAEAVAGWRLGQGARGALPPGCQEQRLDPMSYAEAIGRLRGSSAPEVAAHAHRLAHSPVPYVGLAWRRGDEVLACGQYAREGPLVGLYDVFTAPAARGQGLAQGLCARLLRQALGEGARSAYLQVDEANAPGRAAYARLGFRDGDRYHYRSPIAAERAGDTHETGVAAGDPARGATGPG